MELEYYHAAMKGKIDAFEDKGSDEIESILTLNKNTILHIHFTNDTDNVSDTFVEKVLGMCPALLSKTNVKGETILHIAARYGHHEIVGKLIDCAKVLTRDIDGVGADKRLVRALNDKKETALHEAALSGHTEVVEALINEEPDHSYFGENDGGETPLYIAIERRHWNVVDIMLDNHHSPQWYGPNGRTALHAATIFANAEIVSKLLTRNLLLAKQADENGWVPLHLAAIVGCSEIVELLVSKDRSTAYMRDKKGRTPLHFAAISEKKELDGNMSAMKIILKYCPDCCELVDEKGCNALHYTAMDQASFFDPFVSEEGKEILKNAPLMRNLFNEKDGDGNTPLHYIARLASKWKTHYNHPLLEPQFQGVVDKMACNKYGQNPLDVVGADVTPDAAFENKLFRKLQDIGAILGGRVLDKHLREKKHDPAVDEKEKENTTDGEDDLPGDPASLSVVAILIASVTFAAGFTLPGGLKQDKGSPILKYNAAFIAFVITDSLSFVFSVFAVIALFFPSAVGEKVEFGKNFSYEHLESCFTFTVMAMVFMVLAFGTGLYAVLGVSKGYGVVTLLIVLGLFIMGAQRIPVDDKTAIHHFRNRLLFRARDISLSSIV